MYQGACRFRRISLYCMLPGYAIGPNLVGILSSDDGKRGSFVLVFANGGVGGRVVI